ncbi:MAG TPA: glycosyltransferase family 39 protein [Solirubrobacteraceae bacterium]|nr:glycosyltransferase family 39 protein [Solirubrobacteraceae bacterium]
MVRRRRARRILIIGSVLALALALRVGEVQRTSYRPVNDAGSYLTLASQIAHSGEYTATIGAGGTHGPSAYFPPGFPYLLAAVDLIDGHPVRRGPAIHPARLSQAALGTVTVAMVGLVAEEALGALTGLIALVLAAIYPVLIELSAILVAENLFTPFVLGSTWAMLRAGRSAHPYRWIAAAGVLTGLATLTHFNGVVLILPLAFAAWRLRRTVGADLARPLAGPALLLFAAAVTVAPWTIRNAVELHRFVPVSDETGITLVGTYNPASAANPRVPYKWRIYYGIPGERGLIRRSSHLSEPALGAELQSQALRYIGKHPLSPLAVIYDNSRRLLELEGTYAWHASARAMGIDANTASIGVFSFWALTALALAGALTRAARAAPRWLWATPVLLWLSVALINAETPRFREPVDPFLILLAACGLAAALRAAAARLRGAAAGGDHGTAVTSRPRELVEMVEGLT